MRLIPKWLLPLLTCLLIVGALLLPRYVSQTRDAPLFGQVHAEELDAAPLPTSEPPTLLDRMALYAGQISYTHPVLSFRGYDFLEEDLASPEQEPLIQATRESLTGADILPDWIFEEEPLEAREIARLLLWDPAAADTFQAPAVFWELGWSYSTKRHSKDLKVLLDAETSLPIYLWVFDTNLSQWQPYDTDHLRIWAERFFDLLDLDIQEVDYDTTMSEDIQLHLQYSLAGTDMVFRVIRGPTTLTIQPCLSRGESADTDGGSTAFDG